MIHLIIEKNGKKQAKCGSRPWGRYAWQFQTTEDESKVDCKRCLNKVTRRTVSAPITENMIGKIFHTSWGYDMTINEYVKVIGQSEKSLLVQECSTITNGLEYAPGSMGEAKSGDLKKDGLQFRIYKKVYTHTDHWGRPIQYEYWKGTKPGYSGVVDHWSEWSGQPNYENHCD